MSVAGTIDYRPTTYDPGPSLEDSAWWLGFDLGYDEFFVGKAEPQSRWSLPEKDAFRQGYAEGLRQFDREWTQAFPDEAPPDPDPREPHEEQELADCNISTR